MKKISVLFCAIATVAIIASCTKAKETYSTRILNEWEVDESETIDLGLSVEWASCNLGAKTPDKAGSYFAWGEIETKTSFNQSNYKFFESTGGQNYKYTKYGEDDKKTVLEIVYDKQTKKTTTDDAARAIKNKGGWHIPTPEQFQELIDNCTWEWASYRDQLGMYVTSKKNGKSIFLPATGFMSGSSVTYVTYFSDLTYGNYLTNTVRYEGNAAEEEDPDVKKDTWYENVHVLQFCATSYRMTIGDRYYGRTIRAVKDLS